MSGGHFEIDRQLRRQVAAELSGRNALCEAQALYARDHWFSYSNFARTAAYVADRLREIGLSDVRIDAIPANYQTVYSGWTTAQAWDVTRGKLTVVAPTERCIADWDIVPQHVIMRSEAACGTFPVVPWNGGDDVDLSGRIAFTHLRPAEVQHQIKALGGRGIVSDFLPILPGVRSRESAMDHVLWEQVCFRPNPGGMWGFMISPQDGLWLEQQLARGPVQARVDLDGRNDDGVTHAIDATLPGDEPGEPQLLLAAHLYEPGANDNASGAGLVLELLRALRALQQSGKVRLKRGIRVLFAYEGRGTIAWIHRHERECQSLIAGLNLDEIGVDQSIGRSTAHIFMPPYSNPSFVGDVLIDLAQQVLPREIRWKAAADRADIILDTRFSDPSIGVPTPCMIQYPAWTYHTSMDTPDVLSPQVLQAFGELSACYLLQLANLVPAHGDYLDALLSDLAAKEAEYLKSQPAPRRALLRERLSAKAGELMRWGVADLPRLSAVIDSLPTSQPARSGCCDIIPQRMTPATPGGTQVAELLVGQARTAFRGNLLDHGLDLVFHHFFYWADGVRSIEDICVRIEDEMHHQHRSDAIPRTTTGELTHDLGASINRQAVVRMYEQLADAGLIRLVGRSA